MEQDVAEKIRSLFIVGFEGETYEEELGKLVENDRFGAFILFRKNARDADRLGRLLSTARSRAAASGAGRLLFAADEEGGLISPLGDVVGRLPAAMALGAAVAPELLRQTAQSLGSALKSLGLDLILAPVLDVDLCAENPVIGTRSFGGDPGLVSRMGNALLDGLRTGGLLACAKHFPGHGRSREDSHVTLPVVECSKEELVRSDLVPFRRAVEAGVECLMTAHVAYPSLDGGMVRPATVSPSIVGGLLGRQLGFKGVVISDSLEMKGLSRWIPPEEACAKALMAGVDALLCVDPRLAMRCGRRLASQAAADSELRARIEEAYSKICTLKELAGRRAPRAGPRPLEPLLRICYGRSVRFEGISRLELSRKMSAVSKGVFLLPERLPGYGRTDVEAFRARLSRKPLADKWRTETYPFDPDPAERATLRRLVGRAQAAVLGVLARGTEPGGQRKLAEELVGTGKVVAGVALLDPRPARKLLPGVPLVLTYGFWREAMEALGATLLEEGIG